MTEPEIPPPIDPQVVAIGYTNYKGESDGNRRIRPIRIHFGSNEWHPEPQWLMDAFDMDKQAERTFAVKDISGWYPERDRAADIVRQVIERGSLCE